VFLNKDGTVKGTEVFISGFLENNSYIGRPVDVLFLKDGSMLISDDYQRRGLARDLRQPEKRREVTMSRRCGALARE
jgi:glucose/arabinose dehydrogenase